MRYEPCITSRVSTVAVPFSSRRLSQQECIPHKFLELILLHLKNKGLVDSKKGRNGGYYLAKAPEQITIGSVIRLIDGPLAPLPCASETAYQKMRGVYRRTELRDTDCDATGPRRDGRNSGPHIISRRLRGSRRASEKADEIPEELMFYI